MRASPVSDWLTATVQPIAVFVVGMLVTIVVSFSRFRGRNRCGSGRPPNSYNSRDILGSTAMRGDRSIIAAFIAREWLIGVVPVQT
jgi:hypothetical protein